MDIYDYLKMDHKKVAKLFKLYETAKTDRNKLEIFEMINKELRVHADSEAETFYRALELHKKSEDEALHGEEEHYAIKAKLQEIFNLGNFHPSMDKKMLELKALVEHHVSDEEGKTFKVAKKIFSKEEAIVLKLQMHDLKEKLLTSKNIKEEELV
jgi:hypothetical protein